MLHEIAAQWRSDERMLRRAPHRVRPQPGREVRHRPARRTRSSARAAAGDLHVAFGVTEPDAGTDTRVASRPRAEPDGNGGWRIHGRKIWTTKALESEVVCSWSRTGDADSGLKGLSLFLADLDPDYVDIRAIPKVGRNAVGIVRGARTTACQSRAGDCWAKRATGSVSCCTGSTPSACCSPRRRAASVRSRSIGPSPTPRTASCSTGRSAPTRRSATRSPTRHAQLKAAWMMALHAGRRYDAGLAVRRGGEHRQVPRRRGLVLRRATARCRPLGGHGLRVRVPRGAVLARGPPAEDRAGDARR